MDKTKLLNFVENLKQQSQNLNDSIHELLDGQLELLDDQIEHNKSILEIKYNDVVLAQNFYSNILLINKIIEDLQKIIIEEKEK